MSEQVFQDDPNVELLQWLARGSLKQNLLRAIRLWVWLRSLYGNSQIRLVLGECFTYAEWRNAFFSSTHPKGEDIPKKHDPVCHCARTTAEWLFNANTAIVPNQWKELMLAHTGMEIAYLDKQLQQRLFGITRRSLQGDLEILADLGWLQYKNHKYHRVKEFPQRPINSGDETTAAKLSSYALNFLHEDLLAIAETHSHSINGVQRFFLKLDYIIPHNTLDLVDDWQHQLRKLWTKTPVPPIKLTYKSASLGDTIDCVVYPVCIYYVQRAVYLCACGESPERQTDWYNFRLDRIQSMTPLQWTNPAIPSNLQQYHQKSSLPSPDYITLEMSKAWGFDFYLPSRLMLLRFDRNFHERYVKGTERHETFKEITYEQAQHLIQQEVKQRKQQQALLKILTNRSPKDAYYQVFIRYKDSKNRDNNIIMRLRAWRPNCEVFLPFDLRQSIAADVAEEFEFYQ
ncbi:MAG: TIGR03985 family CRISPR-associated protein [Scytonema sp. PMC 1069.18]|nr:TIGR03985 family CRISPR-associated protein [Scytonema sp. PMC 1069.18]MEC4884259.1 TIGR03985 family CRISPR-associated protein [Scytonema sp. PMC 1070.18]